MKNQRAPERLWEDGGEMDLREEAQTDARVHGVRRQDGAV